MNNVQALQELYRSFDILNKKYFNNGLIVPVITIQTNNRKNSAGWFTVQKIWESKTGDPSIDKDYVAFHEINICSEGLNRTSELIIETLLHEMVHYQNTVADIKDMSNGNKHNKRFKEAAEKVGLICDKDAKYGYGSTRPSEQLVAFIQTEIKPLEEAFEYYRVTIPKLVKVKTKTMFKYECPKCGLSARGKEGIKILCDECKVLLQMEPKQ